MLAGKADGGYAHCASGGGRTLQHGSPAASPVDIVLIRVLILRARTWLRPMCVGRSITRLCRGIEACCRIPRKLALARLW